MNKWIKHVIISFFHLLWIDEKLDDQKREECKTQKPAIDAQVTCYTHTHTPYQDWTERKTVGIFRFSELTQLHNLNSSGVGQYSGKSNKWFHLIRKGTNRDANTMYITCKYWMYMGFLSYLPMKRRYFLQEYGLAKIQSIIARTKKTNEKYEIYDTFILINRR
jgi:hypothetical protein